jgi:flagellar basal body rod protein FlgG
MSDIFQIANIGLLDNKQRLESISMNAASASLTGYRRHVITGRTFDTAFAATAVAAGEPTGSTAMIAAAARPLAPQVDLQRGSLIATDRPLDLAIETDGAFFALTDGTQTWLTRAGQFRLNEAGVLVGERELRVIGTQGDINLPGSSDLQISADGHITHDGVVLATLQLFKPIDRVSLQAATGSLLLAPSGMEPVSGEPVRIRSGALEASNTDASREMLSLMTLSRQFESLSRIVQSYDDLLGRTIQKLGEV